LALSDIIMNLETLAGFVSLLRQVNSLFNI